MMVPGTHKDTGYVCILYLSHVSRQGTYSKVCLVYILNLIISTISYKFTAIRTSDQMTQGIREETE